jgi:hypothetical protein
MDIVGKYITERKNQDQLLKDLRSAIEEIKKNPNSIGPMWVKAMVKDTEDLLKFLNVLRS